MMEDVSAYDTIKVAVYEWKIPHLMLDESDVIDRSSFQTAVKGFECCFRNVESYHLKSLFAEKYGMTAGPAAYVEDHRRAFAFQVFGELRNFWEWWRRLFPSPFSPGQLPRMCFLHERSRPFQS